MVRTSVSVVPSTSISPETVKAPTLKLAKASTTAAPLPAPSKGKLLWYLQVE